MDMVTNMALNQAETFLYRPIDGAEDALIDSKGHLISGTTGKDIHCWVDSNSGQIRTRLRNYNGWFYTSVAFLVLSTFGPKDPNREKNPRRRSFVGYIDNDKSNLDVRNLYWTTVSEIQKRAAELSKRKKLELIDFPHFSSFKEGLFPNHQKCLLKPGFYYIPFVSNPVVVNERGLLFNLFTRKPHLVRKDRKGYLITTLRSMVSGKFHTFRVHRVVAMVLVPKPERHKNRNFQELQVNHIDGNKTNNWVENLEWVTNDENMKHARKTGLFDNEVPVLSKRLSDGKIEQIPSISECSRRLGVDRTSLRMHLSSVLAGRIVCKGCVFKLDNDSNWPEWIFNERDGFNINRHQYVVAENSRRAERFVFLTIEEACNYLGLNHIRVKLGRQRKGKNASFDGWVFTPTRLYFKKGVNT